MGGLLSIRKAAQGQRKLKRLPEQTFITYANIQGRTEGVEKGRKKEKKGEHLTFPVATAIKPSQKRRAAEGQGAVRTRRFPKK